MSAGRFIVLEGLDGAGTTTQCAALKAHLTSRGHAVHVTNEPSTGPIGTLVRQALTGRLTLPAGLGPLTPETLALLFAADRVDHLAGEVEPLLERGVHVLSDRYLLSSLAYQGAQLGLPWVAQINARARKPDVTLFLQISADAAGRRRKARGGAQELYERAAVQRRTAVAYTRAIALRRKAGERIEIIDGAQSREAVTSALVARLKRFRLA